VGGDIESGSIGTAGITCWVAIGDLTTTSEMVLDIDINNGLKANLEAVGDTGTIISMEEDIEEDTSTGLAEVTTKMVTLKPIKTAVLSLLQPLPKLQIQHRPHIPPRALRLLKHLLKIKIIYGTEQVKEGGSVLVIGQ